MLTDEERQKLREAAEIAAPFLVVHVAGLLAAGHCARMGVEGLKPTDVTDCIKKAHTLVNTIVQAAAIPMKP